MSAPFLGEIRMVGFSFPPTGWAECNGQLMAISQNTALFALLGTYYGGDGRTTFALPNLNGSYAMHWGDGAGLSERFLGETGGSETVTLLPSEIPAHTHNFNAFDDAGNNPVPTNNTLSRYPGAYLDNPTNLNPMAFQSLSIAGSSLPHNNLQPYVTLVYVIALQGVFPARG